MVFGLDGLYLCPVHDGEYSWCNKERSNIKSNVAVNGMPCGKNSIYSIYILFERHEKKKQKAALGNPVQLGK